MFTLLFSLRDCFRARAVLQAEILALRHQLLVLQRSSRGHSLPLRWADRILWVRLSRLWNDWRSALLLVKPETVIAWHRKRFRPFLSSLPRSAMRSRFQRSAACTIITRAKLPDRKALANTCKRMSIWSCVCLRCPSLSFPANDARRTSFDPGRDGMERGQPH